MKQIKSHILLGSGLLLCSFIFYYIHFLVFHDPHHLFIYLLGDIAFVFIEVLMVSLIIERVMQRNDKKSRMEKLNMVIGAFFSEAGSDLLEILSSADKDRDVLHDNLVNEIHYSEKDFRKLSGSIKKHQFKIEIAALDLEGLKVFLLGKRNFMLRMLENPNLMEHEKFSDVLWAVFHLAEELKSRDDLTSLPDSDYKHIKGDIVRAYIQLTVQWLSYMRHLKSGYPYLFSLAVRTNPLNRKASAVVTV